MWRKGLVLFTYCFTCGVVFCEKTHHELVEHRLDNNNNHEIFEELSHRIGASQTTAKELSVSFENIKQSFDLLNIVRCTNQINTTFCNTCFSIENLFDWYNTSTSDRQRINQETFQKLSTGIVYILAESFSRRNFIGDVCKRNSDIKILNTETTTVFKTLQNKYGNGLGIIDEESLERILENVTGTVGCHHDKFQTFSAHDVIQATSVPEDQINEHDFEYVAGYVILQLVSGKCFSSEIRNDGELPTAHFFVDDLLTEFGNGTHLTVEQFHSLYSKLKLGRKQRDEEHHDNGEHHDDEEHHDDGEHHEQHEGEERQRIRRWSSENNCYSAEEVLKIYSMAQTTHIDKQKLEQVCPALIQQLESGACVGKSEEIQYTPTETSSWKPWIGMLVSITGVSLASLSGIVAALLSRRKWFPYFIMYLISLAVAVLIGDAMMHLFPHAVNLHQHKPGEHEHAHGGDNPMLKEDSYLWKSLCFLIGIYMFFMFEVIMHAFSGGHAHSHGMEEHVASSSTNNIMKVKGTLGMSEGSSIYDLNDINTKIVARPSGLHECQDSSSDDDDETDLVETTATSLPDVRIGGSPSSQDALVKKTSNATVPSNPSGTVSMTSSSSSPSLKSVSLKQFQSVAWMVLIGDGIHNFLDGIAIGVAFSESWPEGLHGGISTSIAILCHELPHELGDFAVLLNSGLSIRQALVMNFISSLTAYIGGIIGVCLGTQWPASPWILALTAGLFVYIALVDMLPEVLHSAILKLRPGFCIVLASTGLWTGFGFMLVLAAWEEDIKSALK